MNGVWLREKILIDEKEKAKGGNSSSTHRHILIFTQIKLSINGCVSHFWKAAEEFGNKLSCQALLLWPPLHAIQDDLVGIFVLHNERRHMTAAIWGGCQVDCEENMNIKPANQSNRYEVTGYNKSFLIFCDYGFRISCWNILRTGKGGLFKAAFQKTNT